MSECTCGKKPWNPLQPFAHRDDCPLAKRGAAFDLHRVTHAMTERKYPDLRPQDLEPHFSRHVAAMTTEELHSKADIAMQLAWRDKKIADRDAAVAQQSERIAELNSRLENRTRVHDRQLGIAQSQVLADARTIADRDATIAQQAARIAELGRIGACPHCEDGPWIPQLSHFCPKCGSSDDLSDVLPGTDHLAARDATIAQQAERIDELLSTLFSSNPAPWQKEAQQQLAERDATIARLQNQLTNERLVRAAIPFEIVLQAKLDDAEATIAQLRESLSNARAEGPWAWSSADDNHLESMGEGMVVQISAGQLRGLLDRLTQECETGYKFLRRWQRWGQLVSHTMGWAPRDVWPDDTQTRRRFVSALRERGSAQTELRIIRQSCPDQYEVDGSIAGTVQSYIGSLEQRLEKAFALISSLLPYAEHGHDIMHGGYDRAASQRVKAEWRAAKKEVES